MRTGHQGAPVAGLPGLPSLPGPSFASAVPSGEIPVSGRELAPVPHPIDRSLDAWFFERLDRLLGRR